jgi:transposase
MRNAIRVALSLVVAGVLIAGLGVGTASAAEPAFAVAPPSAGPVNAYCHYEFNLTISPGLSVTPRSAKATTGGRTGKITCSGRVYGKAITGPGTVGTRVRAVASTCAYGHGTAEAWLELPTADGTVKVQYRYTFNYVGATGSFMGKKASGGFAFAPTKGNCVTAPITKAHVEAFGVLTYGSGY